MRLVPPVVFLDGLVLALHACAELGYVLRLLVRLVRHKPLREVGLIAHRVAYRPVRSGVFRNAPCVLGYVSVRRRRVYLAVLGAHVPPVQPAGGEPRRLTEIAAGDRHSVGKRAGVVVPTPPVDRHALPAHADILKSPVDLRIGVAAAPPALTPNAHGEVVEEPRGVAVTRIQIGTCSGQRHTVLDKLGTHNSEVGV